MKRGTLHQDSTVKVENLNIEHIMPKVWEKNWPLPHVESEGDEEKERRKRDRDNAVHYPGNWTIVTSPFNSNLSNRKWEGKRDSFAESPLFLNREVAEREKWDEEEIEKRAKELAEIACKRWPLDPEEFPD